MTVLALIGAKALYLLFGWLLSAMLVSAIAQRKGLSEGLGAFLGLVLPGAGIVAVLLLPARADSRWRTEGRLPGRRSARGPSRPHRRRSVR